MRDLVQRVMQAGSAGERLEQTGWLDESSPEELEALYDAYREKFTEKLQELRAELGAPGYVLPGDAEWFSQWYPEAFAAAAWKVNDAWLCLAAEHHDRETPIGLLVRSLTAQELDELSK